MEMLSNKLLTNLTSELQFPTTRIPGIETESKIMEIRQNTRNYR